MDLQLFWWINRDWQCLFFDGLMPLLSERGILVVPGILLIAFLIRYGGRRGWAVLMGLVVAITITDIGSEQVLKNMASVKRPYALYEGVHVFRSDRWITYNPADYAKDPRQSNGFPSTHAGNIAAIAAVLAVWRRRSLWITVPVALGVGISRVYTGNHLPSAVLVGYVWGGLCGTVVGWACQRFMIRGRDGENAPAVSGPQRMLIWGLSLWTLWNFVFVCVSDYGLVGDEAQYWDWSRHLDLSYYSKPPMIAYIIALMTRIGGDHEWAIRSGAVLCSTGSLALIYALTRRIARDERTALLAAVFCMAMPLSWAGGVLMTIDAPLVLFWAFSLYAFHRAVSGEARWWWITGLALGLAMITKYTIVLLIVSFALYLLLVDRRPLRSRGPYIALAIMLVCMSGVLYWNWAHDWISLRHTAAIGAGSEKTFGKTISHFFEYFGGQLLMVSPVLFGMFGWGIYWCGKRFRRNRDAAFLFLACMVLFGFYAIVALTRPPQPNWPACAYLAAAPAAALAWRERPRRLVWRRVVMFGVMLGCAIGALPRAASGLYLLTGSGAPVGKVRIWIFEFAAGKDPTNRLYGGRELGEALGRHVNVRDPETPFIFSDRYQMTAAAAFYTPGRPQAFCMNLKQRRQNQYDLWDGWDALKGKDGIFVTGGDAARAQIFIDAMVKEGAFTRGEVIETGDVKRGQAIISQFTLCRMYGYTGYAWGPPDDHRY